MHNEDTIDCTSREGKALDDAASQVEALLERLDAIPEATLQLGGDDLGYAHHNAWSGLTYLARDLRKIRDEYEKHPQLSLTGVA